MDQEHAPDESDLQKTCKQMMHCWDGGESSGPAAIIHQVNSLVSIEGRRISEAFWRKEIHRRDHFLTSLRTSPTRCKEPVTKT